MVLSLRSSVLDRHAAFLKGRRLVTQYRKVQSTENAIRTVLAFPGLPDAEKQVLENLWEIYKNGTLIYSIDFAEDPCPKRWMKQMGKAAEEENYGKLIFMLLAGSICTNKLMTAKLNDLWEADRAGFDRILTTKGILNSCTKRGNRKLQERKELIWGVRRKCLKSPSLARRIGLEMLEGRRSVQVCTKEWGRPKSLTSSENFKMGALYPTCLLR